MLGLRALTLLYTLKMKKIAVIGTGIMGSGIASNYLKNGYQVIIWNRSPEKTMDLQAAGALVAANPKTATEQADIIFEVTADDTSSKAVWMGDEGIIAGANGDKTLIASGTFSIDWTSQLAAACSDNGFVFFDMPLTGGRIGAESGSLTLLVGGNEQDLDSLKPDLEPISSKILYFGLATSGMKYKLVLNSLQAAHIAAFGEAMQLATDSGLDAGKVGEALSERPGGVVTDIAWRAYQRDNIPLTFSVDWILKDLEYAKQLSGTTATPILDDILTAYKLAQADGRGDEDWTTVIKVA
jgi:3-hydroxyisobutyrate dehydrogenase-like beta-hydroxyacid dehydrogenase